MFAIIIEVERRMFYCANPYPAVRTFSSLPLTLSSLLGLKAPETRRTILQSRILVPFSRIRNPICLSRIRCAVLAPPHPHVPESTVFRPFLTLPKKRPQNDPKRVRRHVEFVSEENSRRSFWSLPPQFLPVPRVLPFFVERNPPPLEAHLCYTYRKLVRRFCLYSL